MYRTIAYIIVVLGISQLAQQSPLSLEDPALCNETDEMCIMRKQLRNVMEQLNRVSGEDSEEFDELSPMKRKSSYVRFGKRSDEDNDAVELNKRKSSYVRFGKRNVFPSHEISGIDKRKSSYVRFGKRNGLDDEDTSEINKRKSSYVRFGRSGNRQTTPDNSEKRKSSYIRFG